MFIVREFFDRLLDSLESYLRSSLELTPIRDIFLRLYPVYVVEKVEDVSVMRKDY